MVGMALTAVKPAMAARAVDRKRTMVEALCCVRLQRRSSNVGAPIDSSEPMHVANERLRCIKREWIQVKNYNPKCKLNSENKEERRNQRHKKV